MADDAFVAPVEGGDIILRRFTQRVASVINALIRSGVLSRSAGAEVWRVIATIPAGAVTNAMLADMPTARFKGRTTAGTGVPEDLTATQATALLNVFTSTLKGLAPLSGGGTTNFLRADGTWATPPGGGGGGVESGLYSALPAAGTAGRLYLPTDAPLLLRDTGSVWQTWHPPYGPLSPPLSTFTTWVNQGTRGVADVTRGYAAFSDAGPSTGADFNMLRVQAVPGATPWNLDLCFRPAVPVGSSTVMGIVLRDSGTGRFKAWVVNFWGNSPQVEVLNWQNVTTLNGRPYGTSFWPAAHLCPLFLRVTNDATKLYFYTSPDGTRWDLAYQENLAGDYVATIDQAGYGIDVFASPVSNTAGGAMAVYHCAFS